MDECGFNVRNGVTSDEGSDGGFVLSAPSGEQYKLWKFRDGGRDSPGAELIISKNLGATAIDCFSQKIIGIQISTETQENNFEKDGFNVNQWWSEEGVSEGYWITALKKCVDGNCPYQQ